MKATGIIRRIDDLGRVVIPKEVRRTMKIKEGDPLEIFLEGEMVCFRRYNPIEEREWEKALNIVGYMIEGDFALLNRYGEVMASRCAETVVIDTRNYSKEIRVDGECEGYLMALQEDIDRDKIAVAVKMIEELFRGE